MGKIKNIFNYINNFFTNNISLKLLSLLIALGVWFIVIWSVDPSVINAVKNVPIRLDFSKYSAISQMGLNVIDGNNLLATVYIKGNRNIVGVIQPEDLLVKASVDNITEAGTYELAVEANVKNKLYKDIEFSAITPSVVKVKVDKIITKSIPLEVICNGATVPEDYILGNPISSIDKINITGPEKDIDKVDKGLVVCDVNKKISQTIKLTENIVLKSNTLIDVDDKYINLDNEIVNITLPVLKKKILPLTIDFINQPKDFPINDLKYKIEPSKIEIAGPENEIDKKESINVAYIDMKKLKLDNVQEYSINIPSNFVNIENIEKVKVVFDVNGMSSKILSNILIKVPYTLVNHNIAVNSKKINNVEIVGKKDVLSNLVAGDVVAEIEINDNDISAGQMTVPLKISVPGKGLVWAVGDYTSIITITDKE